jgi:small GTP-binding protein
MKNHYKTILIGNTQVGKTSILNSLKGIDPNITQTTLGAEYLYLEYKDIILDIWDTPGQERMRSFVKVYFNNIQYCLIVCDISNKKSILDIQKIWYYYFIKTFSEKEKPIVFLLGNKIDLLKNNNKYSENINLIKKISKDFNLPFFLTCSFDMETIEKVLENIYLQKDNVPVFNNSPIIIDESEIKQDCCSLQ